MLALTPAIDIESGVASIETLKRRKRGIVRQVPLPPKVLRELDRVFKLRIARRDPQLGTLRLWRRCRTTAWRYVKAVMAAARITGTPAMPKSSAKQNTTCPTSPLRTLCLRSQNDRPAQKPCTSL
ncbi:MAG: hypothetical protein WA776_15920 [Xanthobacteraceae bacterium]